VLRNDGTNEAVGIATLGPGVLQYDSTGPELGEEGSDLFLNCTHVARFEDVELTERLYRIELPTGELTNVLTSAELLEGFSTDMVNNDLENERQALRTSP
jgi:hypothetical protein